MKRNRILFWGMLVLLLASTLVFTGCGGPKALAKQYVRAERTVNKAKMSAIQEKVEKMSDEKQLIFLQEYIKLSD